MSIKSRRTGLIISSLILILLAFGVAYASYALFFGSNAKAPDATPVSEVISKVRAAEAKGGTLELTENDINGITQSKIKNGINKGGVYVKSLYTDISENKITIYAPVEYKGLSLLLSSDGKLAYENDKVVYTPTGFKVGKLPISKGMVMSRLQQFSKDGIDINNDRIEIDKSFFPFDIQSFSVKGDKIVAQIKKHSFSNIFGEISENNEGTNSTTNKNSSGNQSGSSDSINGTNKTNTQTSNKNQGSKVSNEDIEKRRALLREISAQLGAAYGDVKTSKEKAVISAAISAVNSMAANPAGGIKTGGVKSLYSRLSPEEKARVKSAIFSNVDMMAASELARLFGM